MSKFINVTRRAATECKRARVDPATPLFDGYGMNRKFERNSARQEAPGARAGSPAARLVTLEVCRGITRFPNRPVLTERFLIGAAEQCHLRLGGDTMPALHSILLCRNDEIHLEALAQSPALSVNGTAVTSAALSDGDTIEIGPFALLVHNVEQSVPTASASSAHAENHAGDVVSEEGPVLLDIADFTAEELVDALEADEQLVHELESGRQLGAQRCCKRRWNVPSRMGANRQTSRKFLPLNPWPSSRRPSRCSPLCRDKRSSLPPRLPLCISPNWSGWSKSLTSSRASWSRVRCNWRTGNLAMSRCSPNCSRRSGLCSIISMRSSVKWRN